ncbi:unnamed protein product [Nippostrongylus brasiliensis]|uniref:Prothymosin alpha-like n=1 Tax=Nippostrongylus brasiliensis TaxID=27835 RepID=A0A0N4XX41_NIPBR|nr:unnamed protein product [Nippostrongylus brasiliensis]
MSNREPFLLKNHSEGREIVVKCIVGCSRARCDEFGPSEDRSQMRENDVVVDEEEFHRRTTKPSSGANRRLFVVALLAALPIGRTENRAESSTWRKRVRERPHLIPEEVGTKVSEEGKREKEEKYDNGGEDEEEKEDIEDDENEEGKKEGHEDREIKKWDQTAANLENSGPYET